MSCRPWRATMRRSTGSFEKALAAPGGSSSLALSLAALGLLCRPSAAVAACTVPGLWSDAYGGNANMAPPLAGTMKLPYCAATHHLTVTLVGTSGFKMVARDGGDGADCQGFAESPTSATDCTPAAGSCVNVDGGPGCMRVLRQAAGRVGACQTPQGSTCPGSALK